MASYKDVRQLYASKKISGRLNLPYQAFAFAEIVPSASNTNSITVTRVALWIRLISRARCLYFSTFPPQ